MSIVKALFPVCSVLALLGAASPTVFGVTIKEDAGSITLKASLQLRATGLNEATDANGESWDPLRGLPGEAEALRFDARRVRFGVIGTYGDWNANVTIRADRSDKEAAASGGRQVQLYYARIERLFRLDENLTTSIRFGLDKSFNNDSSYSSATFILPGDSIVGERDEERGFGLGWMMRGSWFTWGADLHNNRTGTIDGDAHDVLAPNAENGYFYSTRFEFAPNPNLMIAKKMQSFGGKDGLGLLIGLSAQWDAGIISTGTDDDLFTQSDVFTYGTDVVFHWHRLTAGAEYRRRVTESETGDETTGAITKNADVNAEFWDVWLAYSHPLEDYVIEGVFRFGVVDNDSETTVDTPYNTGAVSNGIDNGGDGSTLDLGLNIFLGRQNNSKLLMSYQHWNAERGGADADIIRIQQQFEF